MTKRTILAAALLAAACNEEGPTYPPAPVPGLEEEVALDFAVSGTSTCVRISDVDVVCVSAGPSGERVRWSARASSPIARMARVGDAVCMIDEGGRMVCERQGEPVDEPVEDVVQATARLCVLGGAGDVRCRDRDGAWITILPGGATELASGGTGPGDDALCAVVDGSVQCWPFGATSPGQARTVPGLEGVVDVDLGADHGCALRGDGTVACWGASDVGQLGPAEPGMRGVPVEVEGIDDAIALGLGPQQSCVIRADERVYCWGSLRLPDLADAEEPQLMPGVEAAIALQDRCALTRSGVVWCWSAPRP